MILYRPILQIFVFVFLFVLIRVILFKTGLIYSVKKWWRIIHDCFHVYQSFKVPEFNESMQENHLYKKVSLYLHSLPSMEDSDFTNLITGKKPNDIVLCLDSNQTVEDDFLGARIFWVNEQVEKSESNRRNFVLKIRKADKRRILRPYLQHIHTVADEIEQQRKRDLKLYMNVTGNNGRWRSIPFTHPSTFDTIAMEIESEKQSQVRFGIFPQSQTIL
ncbi:AAA-ATPase [Quillaja saponaria]|uniref:AAA-ATPase n=1 Tax=Quillaja saponaria TaxID=32244 RepID=A0AAD7PQ06_QUISA|nr:AAA-ATPase [Quillaja saponaria]